MRVGSSSSAGLRVFRLDYELVIRKLREYAERAVERGALAVVLVGSLARGNYTAFSDADVVVVVRDDYPKKLPERVEDFMDPTLPVDLEPRVYTLSELLELARSGARIVEEVLRYGVLLAGDRGVLEELSRAREAGA